MGRYSTLENRISEKFGGRELLHKEMEAKIKHQTSEGGCQLKGNGAVVLTNHHLWFTLSRCSKEIEILIYNILSVEVDTSSSSLFECMKGRYNRLVVKYLDSQGNESIVTLTMQSDPHPWKASIDDIRSYYSWLASVTRVLSASGPGSWKAVIH